MGSDPFLAVYHDSDPFTGDSKTYGSVKRISLTCNFSGTTPSAISSSNYLGCQAASTMFTSVTGEDWGGTMYTTVHHSGAITVGGEVWRGCAAGSGQCGDISRGDLIQIYRKPPVTIKSSFTSSDITLYMRWDTTSSGYKVTWYYKLGTTTTKYAEFYFKSYPQIKPYFIVGYFNAELVKVKYFQAGVGSDYCMCTSGWSVMIKNPRYAVTTSSDFILMPVGRSVQGDDTYWDRIYRWGGEKYGQSQQTQYDCLNDTYADYQVKFSYLARNTASGGVKLWPC
jgi:hypothetical protein